MNIVDVFWKNVAWHLGNKNILLTKTQMIAYRKKAGVTLTTVQEIAEKLDIDDYAILFEQLDDEKASQKSEEIEEC
ncbi:hypothetical protein [Enterococcus gallinarum]|uniref:XRE family transcriptional regulator n=1 Tax=Enterococcus gallinarum TaxID=1353 RepID=A0A6I4XNU0_ENTGA|nr:hypothetical protein [Enterococcus gallinarum]MXS25270.1 hypothetical protein [Enterococcus gallinarum]DAG74610.1 MAG TPA: Protein of unknown function (DUF2555) [Caudoviricetes sp.]